VDITANWTSTNSSGDCCVYADYYVQIPARGRTVTTTIVITQSSCTSVSGSLTFITMQEFGEKCCRSATREHFAMNRGGEAQKRGREPVSFHGGCHRVCTRCVDSEKGRSVDLPPQWRPLCLYPNVRRRKGEGSQSPSTAVVTVSVPVGRL